MDKDEIYQNNYDEVKRISYIEPQRTLIDLPKTNELMHVVTITLERKKKLKKKLSRSNSIGNVQGLSKIFDDIQIESEIRKSLSFENVHHESLELPKRRVSGLRLWRWSKKKKKKGEKTEPESTQKRKKSKLTEIGIKLGRRISVTIGDLFLNKTLSVYPERNNKANMNVSPPGSPPELPPQLPPRPHKKAMQVSSDESDPGYLSPDDEKFDSRRRFPSPSPSEYEEPPPHENELPLPPLPPAPPLPHLPPSPPPINPPVNPPINPPVNPPINPPHRTSTNQERNSDPKIPTINPPRPTALDSTQNIVNGCKVESNKGNPFNPQFMDSLNKSLRTNLNTKVSLQKPQSCPSSNRNSNTSDTESDCSWKKKTLPDPPINRPPIRPPEVEVIRRNSIEFQPWYHGNITRILGESLLEQETEDGTFLIRDSQKPNQPYTLMIVNRSIVYNVRIRKTMGSFSIGESQRNQQLFSSVADLVERFRLENFTLPGGIIVRLQNWVTREY